MTAHEERARDAHEAKNLRAQHRIRFWMLVLTGWYQGDGDTTIAARARAAGFRASRVTVWRKRVELGLATDAGRRDTKALLEARP